MRALADFFPSSEKAPKHGEGATLPRVAFFL
jgi:hypothetical protein